MSPGQRRLFDHEHTHKADNETINRPQGYGCEPSSRVQVDRYSREQAVNVREAIKCQSEKKQ